MYYRGANAALLLYDITNMSSFQDIRGWLEGTRPRSAIDKKKSNQLPCHVSDRLPLALLPRH
jgi:GTPase SAR1 family protein